MGQVARETVMVRAKVCRVFLGKPGEGLSNAALQVALDMPKFPEVSSKGRASWRQAFAEASRARDRLNHTLQYLRTARILERCAEGWKLVDVEAANRLCAAAAALEEVPQVRPRLKVLRGGRA
jgi:hypothetical protein